ncbi:MAG: TonB-dependent receptor [Acidobacteria bacterium]|nr:TonB-dependent receptor [Acidobacteriota bacterium]
MKKLFSLALVWCLAGFTPVSAQTINATLGGTVSDSTGALIPGVTISATHLGTGIVATLITNEAGAYQFASIQSGTYKVSAELSGFQTQTYNDVQLGVSQQVRLNFALQVGGLAQSVEVSVPVDTLLATSSSSVGSVLPDSKIKDLPLIDRNVLGLVSTQPGIQMGGMAGGDLQAPAIFAGTRGTNVNTSRDGVSVNDTRHNDSGGFAVTYTSPDLVEEVRVIVAAADAELGRGGGQVQMATRSGTNQYRGSVFYTNRNSALDASSWFNNFNRVQKNYYNRNQFGGRIGGPIVRNKTFFFVLYDGQRFITKDSVVGNVLTAQARQGIFRYFPGVQSGNAVSNNPAVDLQGNSVTPRNATGPLSQFSVFNRDAVRPGFDPSGWIPMAISRMPLPNDFTVGDGLNTAGIRWTRRRRDLDDVTGSSPNINRDQINLRLDHNFNPNNKIFFTGTREWDLSDTQIAPWPDGYGGFFKRRPSVYTVSLVSTLSPTVVNEFRFGQRRQVLISLSGFERPDGKGPEAFATLPRKNGIPFIPKPVFFTENFIFGGFNGTRGNDAPRWSYADSLSWTQGHHAFKAGAELGMTTALGYTNQQVYPYANLGAGGVAVTGIDGNTIPGLAGADQTNARTLLTNLSGSVDSIIQAFVLSGPANPKFLDVSQVGGKIVPSAEKMFLRDWRQNDFSVFFKDDWKIRPSLTLNLGVRYDWYGVGYDNNGLTAAPAGGSSALFGVSGAGFDALWRLGASGGSLTTLQLVGKNSPHPEQNLWGNDYNNFGPAVGVSWSLPWWGKDKTVFRAGYGVNFNGSYDISTIHNNQFSTPGTGLIPTYTQGPYMSLSNLPLPIPQTSAPLQPVPLTDRSQSWQGYDSNWRTPYVQSFNASLQRELSRNLTLEVRYVASKSTKLWTGIPLNDANIFENGILDAFMTTRAGGNAPLFNQLLRGLNLGSGVINGTTVTGSQSLRQSTLTRAFFANGNVGAFADFLNNTATATNVRGGLLRNGAFPENWIKVNPQFQSIGLVSNAGNATYHSMNVVVNRRFAQGFTNQTSYTWSRNLGEQDGEGTVAYRNPRDRSLNKQLLGYHRTHDLRSNGLWQLPFGPGQKLLNDAPSWVSRLVERWQFGAIFSLASGSPLTITAPVSTFTQATANQTPNIAGDFPKSMGTVAKVANGVVYFNGLQQISDPARANVTTLQGLQGQFSNLAIADAQGRLLLVNPQPGELGSLGLRWIEGPGNIGLDLNLAKRVKLTETKEFELRVDAVNVLNHPNFGNPNLNINNNNFGRITTARGSRSFVINSRINF